MPRPRGPLANPGFQPYDESSLERVRRLIDIAESLLALLEDQHDRSRAWQEERELFRAMIDQVPDYLFVKDRESKFIVANKAVADDLGLQPDALIGKTDFDLHPLQLASKFFADEQNVIASGQPMLDIEEFVITPSAQKKWLSTSKVPMRNTTSAVIGIVGISRDVTDRKHAEEQIQYMAHHDPLTGLANRFLLMERLSHAIAKSQRESNSVSVVFVDLDRFKGVNDSLGHSAGDTLLRTLAERMLRCVRTIDTVARLSGDEFVVVLEEERVGDHARALSIAQRLRATIAEPVSIDDHLVNVSCSIGVATCPQDGMDPDALLTNADIAMYRAKQRGRDTYDFFSGSTEDAANNRDLARTPEYRPIPASEQLSLCRAVVSSRAARPSSKSADQVIQRGNSNQKPVLETRSDVTEPSPGKAVGICGTDHPSSSTREDSQRDR